MFPAGSMTGPAEAVAASVAVVLRRGAGGRSWILVGQRFPDAHLPDFWEFPGGKIQHGETGAECARREVEEETGVNVKVRELLMQRAFRYPDREVALEFHLCEYEPGVAQALGCRAVRWVRPANLVCYRFPGANAPILRLLRERGWLGIADEADEIDDAEASGFAGAAGTANDAGTANEIGITHDIGKRSDPGSGEAGENGGP